jgi:alkanesulfonate monooxygenase SsuD/methylene tetrahydromethanopterin reductase-like flavin-dependent oxidoreductase (luciferase family)
LAQQRTIYGFGLGRAPLEFAGFGVSQDERVERWRKGLMIIRRALIGAPVCIEGRHNSVKEVRLRPRPEMAYPMHFFAPAGSPASAERVCEAGLGLMLSADLTESELEAIRAIAERHGNTGVVDAPIMFTSIFLGESREQATELAAEYFEADATMAARHYAGDDVPHNGQPPMGQGLLVNKIIGTATTCLERLNALQKASGSDHIVFEISFGGMPIAMAESNLRRVASDILPIIAQW